MSKLLSTFFYIGYLPAPGTAASLLVFCLYYFVIPTASLETYLTFFFIIAVLLAGATEVFRKKISAHDPGYIVSDEVIATIFICSFIPHSLAYYGAAFALFRLFDISKWLGLDTFQKLPGTLGILADDIMAAVYTLIILFIFQMSL